MRFFLRKHNFILKVYIFCVFKRLSLVFVIMFYSLNTFLKKQGGQNCKKKAKKKEVCLNDTKNTKKRGNHVSVPRSHLAEKRDVIVG